MELMKHQKEAVGIARTFPRYAFFDDTGTGKTAEAIEIIKDKNIPTLVICPISIIERAWIEDLKKFGPDLKYVNLWECFKKGNPVQKHQVGIINFESFRNHYKELADYKMVMVDESSKIKDFRSQITKTIIGYTDLVSFVYLFSGTPAPNNELEYWPQMRVVNPALLGRSYYSFRNKFCYSSGFGGYTWKMNPAKKEEFLEKIGLRSRVIRKEDVLDLPERTFNVRSVYLSSTERQAYREMEKDLITELDGVKILAVSAAVKIMKLREATSGFMIGEDGEIKKTGESKFKELVNLLDEIGNHQVIIWNHFHYEGDVLERTLKSAHRIDGTVHSQMVKDQRVRDFMEGKVQYLIAHPASLGHGVTLTNCQYSVYLSLSHSHEQHYQSRDRIYRKGQKNACTYYYLLAEDTIDLEIMRALENKESTAEAVFRYLKMNR